MTNDKALPQSEELYRQMFEEHGAVRLLVDPESGKIIDANTAASDFYGYPLEELKRKRIMEINTLPEAEVRQVLQKSVSNRRNHLFFKHRLASGEVRDVEVYSDPIEIKERKVLYSIVHDITGRKQAEEMLRYQVQLLQNVSDAIISTDRNLRIRSWNQAAEIIYGWQAQELLGEPIDKWLETERLDNSPQSIFEEALESKGWRGEVLQKRKDGDTLQILASISLIQDENEELAGLVTVNRDMTHIRRIEAELRQANLQKQQTQEFESVERLSRLPHSTVTAEAYGIHSLRQSLPEQFDQFVNDYNTLLDQALEQRAFKVEHHLSEKLRTFSYQLSLNNAGPRDVIEIHTIALKKRGPEMPYAKMQAYLEESRLILLELMGNLVSHYRNYALGFKQVSGQKKQKG